MTAPHPFDLCLAGEISAPVAVARFLLDGGSPEAAVREARARRAPSSRWRALEALVARSDLLARTAEAVRSADQGQPADATAQTAVAMIAETFDRLVRMSPELSVAAYSLGDPDLLEAATAEIADWLQTESLVGSETRVLDIGCGIGRIEASLAGRCARIVGVDISPAMLEEARRRCRAPNVGFQLTDGFDLKTFAERSFDLVLAVDSFPYLVQAGGAIAARHFAEAGRVLRPGGALVILNLSYRSLDEDIADGGAWAQAAGLTPRLLGTEPFEIWDGAAFVFDRR